MFRANDKFCNCTSPHKLPESHLFEGSDGYGEGGRWITPYDGFDNTSNDLDGFDMVKLNKKKQTRTVRDRKPPPRPLITKSNHLSLIEILSLRFNGHFSR